MTTCKKEYSDFYPRLGRERTAIDVAGGGDEGDDDDKDDFQVTVNMDSISTEMTPQFPAGGAAPVYINVTKRISGVASTTKGQSIFMLKEHSTKNPYYFNMFSP